MLAGMVWGTFFCPCSNGHFLEFGVSSKMSSEGTYQRRGFKILIAALQFRVELAANHYQGGVRAPGGPRDPHFVQSALPNNNTKNFKSPPTEFLCQHSFSLAPLLPVLL